MHKGAVGATAQGDINLCITMMLQPCFHFRPITDSKIQRLLPVGTAFCFETQAPIEIPVAPPDGRRFPCKASRSPHMRITSLHFNPLLSMAIFKLTWPSKSWEGLMVNEISSCHPLTLLGSKLHLYNITVTEDQSFLCDFLRSLSITYHYFLAPTIPTFSSTMASRDSTLLHLMSLITTRGKEFNDLKLQKLIKIVEQLDIDLEVNDEVSVVIDPQATDGAPSTQGIKRPAAVVPEGESLSKRLDDRELRVVVSGYQTLLKDSYTKTCRYSISLEGAPTEDVSASAPVPATAPVSKPAQAATPLADAEAVNTASCASPSFGTCSARSLIS
jgi:hypothetical protein